MNTNSRENSETNVETARMTNCGKANQMSRKIDEIKADVYSQFLQAINSAIAKKVLPTLQNSLGTQKTGFNAKMDLRSSGLLRNSEVIIIRKTRKPCPKMTSNQSNRDQYRK